MLLGTSLSPGGNGAEDGRSPLGALDSYGPSGSTTYAKRNAKEVQTRAPTMKFRLAWNLKAWYGLLTPNRERGVELVRMEFRRFLHAIVLLPCQIVRTARRVIYRVLGYNHWLKDFFATWERVRQMAPIPASG